MTVLVCPNAKSKLDSEYGLFLLLLFPSRIPAHRCAFKAHIDQQSASGSCTARHLTWARSRTSLRTTPRSRSEASTEKRNHNTKQELLRPLSLTLSFFRQGYGAGDCSPTPRASRDSLSLSPGHRSLSKPPGIMPTRCFIGVRGVKNECRSTDGSCYKKFDNE